MLLIKLRARLFSFKAGKEAPAVPLAANKLSWARAQHVIAAYLTGDRGELRSNGELHSNEAGMLWAETQLPLLRTNHADARFADVLDAEYHHCIPQDLAALVLLSCCG
jgi:hypothetical protein